VAARRRASIWKMQEFRRYRSLDMLLNYVEPDGLFEGHALAGVFPALWVRPALQSPRSG
jgi:hypothetical protein